MNTSTIAILFVALFIAGTLSIPSRVKPIIGLKYRQDVVKQFASIFIDGTLECGASWISRRTLLTAAHCVFDMEENKYVDPGRMKIHWGSVHLDELYRAKFKQPNSFQAKKASVCRTQVLIDQYAAAGNEARRRTFHDLAIVILNEDVADDGSIETMTFQVTSPRTYAKVQLFGFGNDGYRTPTRMNPPMLKELTMIVIHSSFYPQLCSDFVFENETTYGKVNYYRFDPDLMICTMSYDGGSCNGDSGSPIVMKGTNIQIGILVISDCVPYKLPGHKKLVYFEVFVSLSFIQYHNFIKEYIDYVPN